MLGISRIAVFKKVKKNQLEAIRIGRNWAIPAESLAGRASAPSPGAAIKSVVRRPQAAVEKAEDPMSSMGWD